MNASTTKQKRVIVLQGIHDLGKTTTLLLLIQLLLRTEGSSLLAEDFNDKDRDGTLSLQEWTASEVPSGLRILMWIVEYLSLTKVRRFMWLPLVIMGPIFGRVLRFLKLEDAISLLRQRDQKE